MLIDWLCQSQLTQFSKTRKKKLVMKTKLIVSNAVRE